MSGGSPFWDGWGVGQWVYFLLIPTLLVVALVIWMRQPKWWQVFETNYRDFQRRGDAYRERWQEAAAETLGGRRSKILFGIVLIGSVLVSAWGVVYWGFGPERSGTDALRGVIITSLVALPVYVCAVILDYAAHRGAPFLPLTMFWAAPAAWWLAAGLIETLDRTESVSVAEGIIRTAALVIPVLVLIACRRPLRQRLLKSVVGGEDKDASDEGSERH